MASGKKNKGRDYMETPDLAEAVTEKNVKQPAQNNPSESARK